MEEEDIKLLLSLDHWLSVVPHRKKWKGVIWIKIGDVWKEHKSKIQTDPVKCYEWAIYIIAKILEEHEEENTH